MFSDGDSGGNPAGAVVGQQPFGGARASGTNDKAGSILNLLRWISPRSIKETFAPATNCGYPFVEDESREFYTMRRRIGK